MHINFWIVQLRTKAKRRKKAKKDVRTEQKKAWANFLAELKTDIKYIREDIGLMQKQVRDLNTTSNMGVGGLKVFLVVGTILGAIWTFVKLTD